jgi:hypothetical protein
MTKMLFDGSAAINVMPYAMYQKLRKGEEDLIKTDMILKDFEDKWSPTWEGPYRINQCIPSNAYILEL